jgi:hypothetical protein
MYPQLILHTIPCGIAFDVTNKAIAFNRPDAATIFIDIREGLKCVWGPCGILLDVVEYRYNDFYKVEGDLEKYFKSLIECDFMNDGMGVFLPRG